MSEQDDKEKVKDTLSDIEIRAAKKKIVPSTLGVPDAPNLVVPDPTPITDMSDQMMFAAIGEMRGYTKNMAKALNEELPAIKKIAQSAADNAEDAKKEVMVFGVQIDGIERRMCTLEETVPGIEEKVATDVREGVKTREQVRGMREDTIPSFRTEVGDVKKELKSVKARPGRLLLAFIGVIVAVVSSAFVITWRASAVNTQIQNDRTNNAKQFKTINDTLKTLPRKGDVASATDVQKAVEAADGDAGVEDYCNSLHESTVRRMKRTIARDEWPGCTRFRGQ